MAEMTVDLKYCDFNKVSGALMLASERFAGGFDVIDDHVAVVG